MTDVRTDPPDVTPPSDAQVSRSAARQRRGRSHQITVEPVDPGDATALPGGSDDVPPGRSRSRATAWFAGATLVALVALGVLAYQGWETAKEVKGGNRLEQVSDPALPGYQAEVRPTPTRLLAQLDADGGLADVVLLADGAGGKGGAALFIPGVTVVERDGQIKRLHEIYSEQGWPSVADSIGRFLGAGFTQSAVLTTEQMTEMFESVGELTIENPDPVVVTAEDGSRQVLFPQGQVTLQPNEIVQFMTTTGATEDVLNRGYRAQLVWEAWFAKLAEGGEAARPTIEPIGDGDLAVDLSTVVSNMSESFVSFQPVPLVRVPLEPAGDAPDSEAIAELIPKIIPFPSSSFPGQRPRVRVLDGTGNPDLALQALGPVVAAGGQVTIMGNADRFGVTETRVEYHDPARAEAAAAIGFVLGHEPVAAEAMTDAYDVTVILGADFGS